MKNAIYLITDSRFRKIAGAQANRLATQWKCDVHVFVEDKDVETVDLPGSDMFKVHVNRINFSLPGNIPVSKKWPRVVFLRNYAPGLLKDYDRLLYLDVDILPEKADHSIWDLELADGIGAVSDSATIYKAPRGTGLKRQEWLDRIGVREGRYFNSGVLLINPARWNSSELQDRLAGYYDNRDVNGIKSQDFLNHVFDGRWTELSPRWNFQPPLFELGFEDQLDPVFTHFCTPLKPWFFPGFPGASDRRIEHEEAFFEMLGAVGVAPAEVAEPHRYRRLKVVRQTVRRLMSENGIKPRKERRERQLWEERRSTMARYLQEARSSGVFADCPDFDSELPLQGTLWFDGRNLWLDREAIRCR